MCRWFEGNPQTTLMIAISVLWILLAWIERTRASGCMLIYPPQDAIIFHSDEVQITRFIRYQSYYCINSTFVMCLVIHGSDSDYVETLRRPQCFYLNECSDLIRDFSLSKKKFLDYLIPGGIRRIYLNVK